ncbi:MAG TPA: hypothetical protein VM487_20260 [Phycisphaerae bacterium]|nr:hypothetical protein [Phycisphaerae bacterium]
MTKKPAEVAPFGHLPASPRGDGFIVRHRKGILFISLVVCLAGAYSAYRMPAAVFPQTDFPRVVILVTTALCRRMR